MKPLRVLVACVSSHAFDYDAAAPSEDGKGTYVVRKSLLNSDSAHGHTNRRVDAIRATWRKTLRKLRPDVRLKFFYGLGATRKMKSDEVLLNADDSYRGLLFKMKQLFFYAVHFDYDLVLKCDDDTFLAKNVLARIDANPELPYVGCTFGGLTGENNERYASGGCYRLNRQALKILDQTRLNRWSCSFEGVDLCNPLQIPSEDSWVGHTLRQNGIGLTVDRSYSGWLEDGPELDAKTKQVCDEINAKRVDGEVNLNALAVGMNLSRMSHFNCSGAEMRRLYEEERNNVGNRPEEEYAR